MPAVRTPYDDEERDRIERAIVGGAGISLSDFIHAITGETADEELVDALRAAIDVHQLSPDDEPLDIELVVHNLIRWRKESC
jgi:hypothetical protein